jgi:predicted ATPase
MSERLIVKNFLCLEDIDIEVKDFLILIGPQAAGKSLCAKLLYFARTILGEAVIYHGTKTPGESPDFPMILAARFESFFPKSCWSEQAFYIEYQKETTKFCWIAKERKQELKIHLDHEILAYLKTMQRDDIKPNYNLKENRKIYKYFASFAATDIFIPAGRSFFSLLQKNIFRFLRTDNSIDPFLVEFGVFYEDIKPIEYTIPEEAQTLIHAILKGDYIPGENLLQLADGGKITLELLSSGQQEALPLALVFAYIISLRFEADSFTNIYVEEPEAHLFPDAQEQISRLISFLRYNANHEVTFAITTHSPYILAAFNNLIKAANIVKQNPALKEAVYNVITESMHIDIDCFSAYSLEGGKAAGIIDKETNLIDANAIDSVSESIMEIFNALQDIEFDNSKAGENV